MFGFLWGSQARKVASIYARHQALAMKAAERVSRGDPGRAITVPYDENAGIPCGT